MKSIVFSILVLSSSAYGMQPKFPLLPPGQCGHLFNALPFEISVERWDELLMVTVHNEAQVFASLEVTVDRDWIHILELNGQMEGDRDFTPVLLSRALDLYPDARMLTGELRGGDLIKFWSSFKKDERPSQAFANTPLYARLLNLGFDGPIAVDFVKDDLGMYVNFVLLKKRGPT